MLYFPDVLPKNRLPEREYFFNILNTTHGEYMQKLIHHACQQRNSAEAPDMEHETILVSNKMMAQLEEMPFVSSKQITHPNILQKNTARHCISLSKEPRKYLRVVKGERSSFTSQSNLLRHLVLENKNLNQMLIWTTTNSRMFNIW